MTKMTPRATLKEPLKWLKSLTDSDEDMQRWTQYLREGLVQQVEFVPWPEPGDRVFAVEYQGQTLYPAFQFDCGHPRAIMKDILAVVPKAAVGWPLLSWFEAPNLCLDHRKPCQGLAKNPQAVLTLVRHEFMVVEHRMRTRDHSGSRCATTAAGPERLPRGSDR